MRYSKIPTNVRLDEFILDEISKFVRSNPEITKSGLIRVALMKFFRDQRNRYAV